MTLPPLPLGFASSAAARTLLIVRVVLGLTVLLGAIVLPASGIAAQERHVTTFPPIRIDAGGSVWRPYPRWTGYVWRGQTSGAPLEQDADLVKLSLRCAEVA